VWSELIIQKTCRIFGGPKSVDLAKKAVADTPLMKQYGQIKAKYPDALLLFRVGDFYETFGEDAVKTSQILSIVLTKRGKDSPSETYLAGFPYHSLDSYLPKLVNAGHRVAICDQLEDPKLTKTIVKRGVTELVTPGVSYNDKVHSGAENNFLAAVHLGENAAGVAFLDVSTGEFMVAQGSIEYVEKLIQGFRPKELLLKKGAVPEALYSASNQIYTFKLDEWVFGEEFARENLRKQFDTNSLKGFGIDAMPEAIIAASAVMHYLAETQHDRLAHIRNISRIEREKYVWLDRFTIRNLELLSPSQEHGKALIDILDHTVTPPGARLLRRWLVLPLKDEAEIRDRLLVTTHFFDQPEFSGLLSNHLSETGDLERIVARVATGRINPREIVQLKRSLNASEVIRKMCSANVPKVLNEMANRIDPCPDLCRKIEASLVSDPALSVGKGKVIADGVSAELDELRDVVDNGKAHLDHICAREIERTGISSLKISFNNVFGYYIEVRNTHKDKVPSDWIRKQTLVSAERYITDELKEYENKILGAGEKIVSIESRLLGELIGFMSVFIGPVQQTSAQLAQLDCLNSYATAALTNGYVCPEVNNSLALEIKDGRHPIIEKNLPNGESYIANDVFLDNERQQIMMITGPNMSGKSAFLRQNAIICIMAQIGSYVPAVSAKIGIVDKVFTRVGASDNISSGESTFMVEMNETAAILNNLSERSLVILDELGRGTSTYDGISIAWAVTEYLHENKTARPKTLFATHYHELNEMSTLFQRIRNFNVSIKELGKRIIFMRKLVPGGSAHSFGIHVAKLAGMPEEVLQRAEKVLTQLETNHSGDLKSEVKTLAEEAAMQLSFFQMDDPVLMQIRDEIENIDIDTLTPVEALMKLNEIRKVIGVKR